jgi:hypothetical protein
MAGNFKITFTNPGPQFKTQMAGLADRLYRAIDASFNMVASLLKQTADADIASAGNFGERWTDGLKVNVDGAGANMRLYMTHDIDYAPIFETGGVIEGKPMLWIPLSGTDAAGIRASAFPGGLFSPRKQRASGRPLLFSVTDKKPRYFGIESVTIPRKWHLAEDVGTVMSNYRSIFSDAWARS